MQQVIKVLGAAFPYLLLLLIGFASMAVTWHNYILRDEMPRGLALLRIDGTVLRYFGNFLLLSLIMVGVAIPAAAVSSLLGVAGAVFLLPYVFLVMMPVFYRFSIKLPAIAIGRKDFSMRDAWNFSAHNWWQIVGLVMLSILLSLVVGIAASAFGFVVQNLLGGYAGVVIDTIVQLVVQWFFTILGITMLTSLYGFFVEKRDF
jgi:hypothetical protein